MIPRTLLLFIAIASFSCSKDKLGELYEFQQDFSMYYEQLQQETLSEITEDYIFVLPLQSCEMCLNKALEMIHLYPYPAKLLLVGKTTSKEQLNLLNKIKKKYNFMEDKSSLLFKYETNIGKPSLIILDKPMRKFTLEEVSWEEVNRFMLQ